jgi:hypothetical protein
MGKFWIGSMLGGGTTLGSARSQSRLACIGAGEDVNSESMTGSGYESTRPGEVEEIEEPEYEGTE